MLVLAQLTKAGPARMRVPILEADLSYADFAEAKKLGVRTHKVPLKSVQQARKDAVQVADGTLQRWLLKRDARRQRERHSPYC